MLFSVVSGPVLRMTFSLCEVKHLLILLQKYKEVLEEHATIYDLINKWDALPVAKNEKVGKSVEVIGCFLPNPPDDIRLAPGPNFRKYINNKKENKWHISNNTEQEHLCCTKQAYSFLSSTVQLEAKDIYCELWEENLLYANH